MGTRCGAGAERSRRAHPWRLIRTPNSYLHLSGWGQSQKERRPIDQNGIPIPWINFPAVRILEERLTKDLSLFEFGGDYSTLFYAKKVRAVTSVEFDKKWLNIIKTQVPDNVNIIFKREDVDGDYCRVIGEIGDRYDVVIVDGRNEVNCIKQSISALSSQGVILLDDS